MRDLFNKWKLKIWTYIYGPIYSFKYKKCAKIRSRFRILNSEDSIRYIIKNRCSICRFGDGEFAMIYHFLDKRDVSSFYIEAFQNYSVELGKRLYEVLIAQVDEKKCVMGIPYPIIDVQEYNNLDKIFWMRFVVLDINRFKRILSFDKIYINSCFTRFYINHKKKDFRKYVSSLKEIWENRNICIVEGTNSRLGVHNDLFDNAKKISRILCPAINAFDKYDQIVRAIQNNSKYDLYLIALGHTATVLAYDLSNMGLWAIDIGHIDIEYEWFLRNVNEKEPIPYKYVNEIDAGRKLTECHDKLYESQIIFKV